MTATTPDRIHRHSGRRVRCEQVRTASGAHLIISGDLDLDAVGVVTDALVRLEQVPDSGGVSLEHVTFADSWGLDPIVDAIRRSALRRGPPLRIWCAAPGVERIFDCLGVRWRPFFDLAAWDAADRLPSERSG